MGISSNSQNEDLIPPKEESLHPPSSTLKEEEYPLGKDIICDAAPWEPPLFEVPPSFKLVDRPHPHVEVWVKKGIPGAGIPPVTITVDKNPGAKSVPPPLSSYPKTPYSNGQRRFSRDEVGNKKSDTKRGMRVYRQRQYVTLEELREGYPFAGEQFYDLYKAITCHTADMSILDDDPNLEDWQKTENLAVIRTRKKLVERLCRKYKEDPKEIARFFKCLMTDITISPHHRDLSYACADHSMCIIIQHVKDTSPEMFHEYLSDICLEVVEDDDIGVISTKEYAMSKLIDFKDARIIPIIQRLAEDESAILHRAAKLKLRTAVKKMPELFLDPKYDAIKRANEDFEKNAYIGTW